MTITPVSHTRCKLCAGGRIRPRYKMKKYGLAILKCAECGFHFVDYTNRDYLKPVHTSWDYSAHADRLEMKFDRYCAEIEQFFPLNEKSVLDVGAGGGDFLHQARLRGARVLGLDLDLTGIGFARDTFGITIVPSRIEEAAIAPGSIDAVCMWEVIEHLNDPGSTVKTIEKILKPAGWFFLSTPCLDSAWDRTAFFLYTVTFGMIQFPLTYRFSWAHLQIFSRRHIEMLLRANGFHIRYFDQRTEFTYTAEGYLQRFRIGFFRRLLSLLWRLCVTIIPIRNKMVIYAQKGGAK